ncbi:MAG: CDP-glucose 4,6-dehydratase [Eubacteriales bacterium]|nr:CDP-glucose 4,6-dehydratase [Eubacteriales bacterium]
MTFDREFYKGKRVLLTGHTGFKGTWMSMVLAEMGAEVTGYAREPAADAVLFKRSGIAGRIRSEIGDIRDLPHLLQVFEEVQPEIVIHMAAQPIVLESYRNPVDTYAVNVMGTVNVCECIRRTASVRSFVNVTTDKVYRNTEEAEAFTEEDVLDGFDPYSNSKSCSELVTASYLRSFLREKQVSVSTVRAGNVIGGGDFAADRIIPDCVRAAIKGEAVQLRNPDAVRPFQHVLDPVYVYLMIAAGQYADPDLAGSYNAGPDPCDFYTVGRLTGCFLESWNRRAEKKPDGALLSVPVSESCRNTAENHTGPEETAGRTPDGADGKNGNKAPHEAKILTLDCTKLKKTFGWSPVWNMDTAMEVTVEWYAADAAGEDIRPVMQAQIDRFEKAFISGEKTPSSASGEQL